MFVTWKENYWSWSYLMIIFMIIFKYITIQEFNKFTAEHFAAILAQANLASKSDIANFVKKDRLWW